MDRDARIHELETAISAAAVTYEAGSPTVSDELFDAWKDELRDLHAISEVLGAIGAPVNSEWVKVKHKHPMGSLDKVNHPEEMREWLESVNCTELPFVTEKLDGISVGLSFRKGALVQAWTRGDGKVGEDITRNVAKMKGLPTKPFTGRVRGEIILTKSDMSAHFPEAANPRNTAAGTAKRLDGAKCQHLTILTYEIVEGRKSYTEEAQFQELASYGFRVPTYKVCDPIEAWQTYQASTRASLDYDIDGLVVRLNSLTVQEGLGSKNLRPLGAVAFKFVAESKETLIEAILWQTGGSGRITPVAQFEPVTLGGATVVNASLYNIGYIRQLGLGVGCKALVARAGDVIPRVTALTVPGPEVETYPTHCLSCGAPTAVEGDYIVCTNTVKCPAQIKGRVLSWVSDIGVLEWGDTLVEKLVSSGKVSSVADLYALTKEDLGSLERMGDRSAEKAWETLNSKTELTLDVYLGALSIPSIGSSTIRSIMAAGNRTLNSIQGMTLEQVQAIEGIGPTKSRTIVGWLKSHADLLDRLGQSIQILEPVQGVCTGSSFCFTGEMSMKRSDLEAMVLDGGGEVKSSVTKNLTYLVASDSTTSKAVKAAKYGTKVITESDFLTLIGKV